MRAKNSKNFSEKFEKFWSVHGFWDKTKQKRSYGKKTVPTNPKKQKITKKQLKNEYESKWSTNGILTEDIKLLVKNTNAKERYDLNYVREKIKTKNEKN